MTNTKFRKRALLSSVAMLLVALVALGSATFAWFVSNPNATASGLSLKTTASTGLVVTTDTDVDGSNVNRWSHEATLGKGLSTLNLDPVSQKQDAPGTFYTVEAKGADKYDPKAATPNANGLVINHTATSNVFTEKVYFRLTDGSAIPAAGDKKVVINGLTITANGSASSMKNAIRVAIAKSGTILGTYCIDDAGKHGTLTGEAITYSGDPATIASGVTNTWTGGLHTTLAAPIDLYDAHDLSNVGTNTLSTYENLDVYVWLDGQDTNCFSEGVSSQDASELIQSVELSFALVSGAMS